jgi:tRNA modification GTPase
LVDVSSPPSEEEKNLFEEVKIYPHLVLINKIDLIPNYLEAWEKELEKWGVKDYLPISVKEGKNLDLLGKKIFEKITGGKEPEIPELVPNLRQKISLEKAIRYLENALEELKKPNPLPEIISIEIREAISALSEIIGEVTTEDLLTQIFSTFCIGK